MNPNRSTRSRRIFSRGMALITLTVAAALAVPALPASAHYLQPPGDQEAAPAVVRVVSGFTGVIRYVVPGTDRITKSQVQVESNSGTGVVINGNGRVITTEALAWPNDNDPRFQNRQINSVFARFAGRSWTSDQLDQRQTVPDAKLNTVLRACYARQTSVCELDTSRYRKVIYNTTDNRTITATSRARLSAQLTTLDAPAKTDSTPTVDLGGTADLKPGGAYVAMGYGLDNKLTKSTGTLSDQGLSTADQKAIAAKFLGGGDSVVLIDPASKGTVIGFLSRSASGALSVVPGRDVAIKAGLRLDRGSFFTEVDDTLGWYTGAHYEHSVPRLAAVTQKLPDRTLLGLLDNAKKLQGTAADKSTGMTMHDEAAASGTPSWLLPVVVAAVALLAALGVVLFIRRRRRVAAGSVGSTIADDSSAESAPVSATGQFDANDLDFDDDGLDELELGPTRSQDALDPGRDASPSTSERWVYRDRTDPGTTLLASPADAAGGRYCPQCGVGMTAGDRFCYQCGTPAR